MVWAEWSDVWRVRSTRNIWSNLLGCVVTLNILGVIRVAKMREICNDRKSLRLALRTEAEFIAENANARHTSSGIW